MAAVDYALPEFTSDIPIILDFFFPDTWEHTAVKYWVTIKKTGPTN